MPGGHAVLDLLVTLVELHRGGLDFRPQCLGIDQSRQIADEDAVHRGAEQILQIGHGMAGTHADDHRHIEIELLRLAMQQNGIVYEGDDDEHVRLYVLELLHQGRHVGHELIITFIIDQLDPELRRAVRAPRPTAVPNARFSHNSAMRRSASFLPRRSASHRW